MYDILFFRKKEKIYRKREREKEKKGVKNLYIYFILKSKFLFAGF